MSGRGHIHNVLAIVMGSENVLQLFQGNLWVKILKLECSALLHSRNAREHSYGYIHTENMSCSGVRFSSMITF